MGVLLFRTGLAVTAAVFVFFGGAAARVSNALRRSWVTIVVTIYGLGIALLPSQWELGGHAPAVVGLIPWCAAALALMCSVTLARTQQSEGERS